MTVNISQSTFAVVPRVSASFLGTGGVAPYLYELVPGGAGGSINPSTGVYLAPAFWSLSPKQRFATIKVTDYAGNSNTAKIMVGSPLMLFCDIIQRGMELPEERVYFWDQKIMQPTDSGLYVAVSMPLANPIGSSNRFNADTNETEQYVTMQGSVDVDLISRDSSARDRKEELILALDSDYARRQQDGNSFYIGKLSTRYVNLSEVDGAAIPYRYKATIKIQYVYTKPKPAQYFNQFETAGIVDDSEQEFNF